MLLVIHEVDADGRVSLGENEVVRKDVEGVDLVQEGGEVEGGGRLQVTTQRLVWASGAAQRGYAVEYPRISLHAISREESEQFPRPCIYCQVDAGGETRELRLIPHDAEQLEPIFTAMCQCAELHPDPASDDEGGEGAEGDDAFQVGPSGFITAETLTAMEAGGDGLDEERAAILERLDAVLDDSAVAGEAGAADAGADATDDGQFDDA